MRNGRAQEIEEEQKTAETAAATDAAIVAAIASTSNMRAEGSETKKSKKRKHDYVEMEVDSEKQKQERRKSDLVTCYIRVLLYFQFLFWVPKKFHSRPTLCSWCSQCHHVGPITHVLTCCIEPGPWVPHAQAKRTEGDCRAW